MHPRHERLRHITRRHFFRESQAGIGTMALASLLAREAPAGAPGTNPIGDPLAPKKPHFAAKAKRVIYLHLTGSPPHLDLFDYKPELVRHDGEPCRSVTTGERLDREGQVHHRHPEIVTRTDQFEVGIALDEASIPMASLDRFLQQGHCLIGVALTSSPLTIGQFQRAQAD